MKAILTRWHFGKKATIGSLSIGNFSCQTLELPFRNNLQNVSCIPVGDYCSNRTISNRFGNTFEVMDVPNRSNILFHWGNFPKDTNGCILIGLNSMFMDGRMMIENSKAAFDKFMAELSEVEKFDLFIFDFNKG